MPYLYTEIEPEIQWSNNEFNIYKTYAENDYNLPYEYWFTLDEATSGQEDAYEFDIREFEIYDMFLSINENLDILVKNKYITKEGWKYCEFQSYKKHLL